MVAIVIEAPVPAPRHIPTEALTLACICDVREVVNLRLSFTADILELCTAGFCNRGSLWSCDGDVAVRSVFAGGGCVGLALPEEEAVAGPVGGGGEHEVVAVNVGGTLLLAVKLGLEVKDGSNDVGEWVERADEPSVEELTLSSLQSQRAAGKEEEEN